MLDRGAKAREAALAAATDNPEAKKVQAAFASVLETDAGKLVFAHLFFLAGYDKADRVGGDEAAVGEFNLIRRSFYVDVRNRVPRTHRKTLLEVELLAEEGWGSGRQKSTETK